MMEKDRPRREAERLRRQAARQTAQLKRERIDAWEQRVHPDRWRKMRIRRNLGWALFIGGSLLASDAPSTEEDPGEVQGSIGGVMWIAGGVLLVDYHVRRSRTHKNLSVTVAPNGVWLAYRF